MAKPPTRLATQASLNRRTHQQKRRLLPLSRRSADSMALRYHTALAALATHQGNRAGLGLMREMVVTARLIAQATAVKSDHALLSELEQALGAAHELGGRTGEWFLDPDSVALCAALLTEHERQLRVVPVATLQEVLKRAERLRDTRRPAVLR